MKNERDPRHPVCLLTPTLGAASRAATKLPLLQDPRITEAEKETGRERERERERESSRRNQRKNGKRRLTVCGTERDRSGYR